jgi:hypothetical protein
MMKDTSHLGEDGTEQFTVTTRANEEVIGRQSIHDPFIRSTVKLRGFQWAWKALFGGIKVQVSVDATEGAQRAVMTLNPRQLETDTRLILAERKRAREQGFSDGNCVAQGS